MKTNGFTLVELLAVIVILSLLALIASTSVTKLLKDSKDDIYNIQLNSIKEAAETWGADNLLYLPDAGECKYLTVGVLKEYGLLDENLIDSRNSNAISDDLKIKITTTQGKYGTNITNYEVDSKNIDGCTKAIPAVCVAVTSSNATYRKDNTSQTVGNLPTGNFSAGDEYICDVDGTNKYRFYVLSTSGDNVNLIMNRNINSDGSYATESRTDKVEWISKEDFIEAGGTESEWGSYGNNTKGPITAMKFLSQATENWINIPMMEVRLTDSTSTNSRARMPSITELSNVGCKTASGTSNYGSCPLWVVDYMTQSNYVTGGTNIPNSANYHTSTKATGTASLRNVTWNGDLNTQEMWTYQVRPVITLPKSKF